MQHITERITEREVSDEVKEGEVINGLDLQREGDAMCKFAVSLNFYFCLLLKFAQLSCN